MQTLRRSHVIRVLRAHQVELKSHFGVKSLKFFGSVVRDDAQPGSDVDLLVTFEQPVGLFEFIDLNQYLEELLGCQVDLGTPRSLKPYLKEQVLQEALDVA